MRFFRTKGQTGMGVIEALVAISILTTALVALMGAFLFFLKGSFGTIEKIKAVYALEEGVEVMRFLRDEGWTANIASITSGAPFYLATTTTGWTPTTTNVRIDGMTRVLTLYNVYRDNGDDTIAPQGGGTTLDPGTKRLVVAVGTGAGTTTMVTYIANLYDN